MIRASWSVTQASSLSTSSQMTHATVSALEPRAWSGTSSAPPPSESGSN